MSFDSLCGDVATDAVTIHGQLCRATTEGIWEREYQT
jgi:hypothetical protein